MSAKVIAFFNFKGGVGKTSNVVNIGTILAKYHKKKVLIVDLDSQCSSTYWLLNPQFLDKLLEQQALTAFQLFADTAQHTSRFTFDHSVLQDIPKTPIGFSRIRGLDILPGSFDLLRADELLYDNPKRLECLQKGLQPIRSRYEYIFLDCPPDFHLVARNAFFFADYVLVPYMPDYLSLRGFKFLVSSLQSLKDRPPGIQYYEKVAAFILNRTARVGSIYTQARLQLESLIDSNKKRGLIHPTAKILGDGIRNDVKMGECTESHLPILLFDENSNAAQDYLETTRQFLLHFEALP